MTSKMTGYISAGILLLVVVTVYSECVWPDFFDLTRYKPSQKGFGKYEEDISWETETKVDDNTGQKVNGQVKSKKLITIINNTTMEMSKFQNKQKLMWEIYSCYKPFGRNTFLIKKASVSRNAKESNQVMKSSQTSFRCMKLVQRSKFVVQWMVGRETSRPTRCSENALLNPSPLIYFPVRNLAKAMKIFRYYDLLSDNVHPLFSGGYEMRVFDKNGYPIQTGGCNNEYPSPRIEMECMKSEGLRITLSRSKCTLYGISQNAGSKFSVLASWEEGPYIFNVLLPSGGQKVNSFHCLRVNKKNPTKETAILFLDSVCKSAEPNKKEDSFLQLSLRQKEINDFCTDFSDQCPQTSRRMCSNVAQQSACMKTCNVCPDLSSKVKFDNKFLGDWILQRQKRSDWVKIFEDSVTLPELGTFDAYAVPENKTCISSKAAIMKSASGFVLGRSPGNGCVPRTVQIMLRKISESVLLMYNSGPAPLRYDQNSLSANKWCHNNLLDVNKFAPVFGSQWSYTSPGYSSLGTGTFTLISKEAQKRSNCEIETDPSLKYAAHMKIGIEFSYNTNTIRCRGETKSKGQDGLRFRYDKCTHRVPPGDIHFDCLGTYQVSYDYSVTVLKRTAPSYGRSNPFIKEKYWCIMIPKVKHKFALPTILHPAGECNFPFAFAVYRGARVPAVKLKLWQSLSF